MTGCNEYDRKIAACGNSYIAMRCPVGAAASCDLLIYLVNPSLSRTALTGHETLEQLLFNRHISLQSMYESRPALLIRH